MTVLFPVFFYWFIGAVMHHTEGHYDPSAAKYTLLFCIAVAVMASRDRFRSQITERIWNTALSFCVTLFCYTLARKPLMIYANDHLRSTGVFHGLSQLALVLSVALLILAGLGLDHRGRKVAFRWVAGATAGILFFQEILVPMVSPQPWIDVWVNNTAAVDFFLKGLNPYSQIYVDIYHGAYDYKPGFLYFPGLLFWLAPFRALFGDIRYGFVFSNFLIALGLGAMAKKMKASEPSRYLIPLLWLSFPVVFFVLEQSWIDTVLAACAVLTFWSMERKNWVLSGIFMGAAFSVKQYGFLIGAMALLQLWKQFGWRVARKALISAAVTFTVIVAPFVAIDWRHFYSSTIGAHTSAALRLDAYNATIYLAREYGWVMPGLLYVAVVLAGMALGAWLILRKAQPRLADTASALFVSYGAAFLFGKFAFCNYHFLLASFLLLYLAV